ncbi:MAG: hypothetical protein QXT86_11380 [Archaeoglobaceae archaeon]
MNREAMIMQILGNMASKTKEQINAQEQIYQLIDLIVKLIVDVKFLECQEQEKEEIIQGLETVLAIIYRIEEQNRKAYSFLCFLEDELKSQETTELNKEKN